MSTDKSKRVTRLRMMQTEENYTEARTRLGMLARIPVLPGPLVTNGNPEDAWSERFRLADLRIMNWGQHVNGVDTSADNTVRAGWALEALETFAQRVHCDDEALISDFLADLMHLCDALGIDLGNELEMGRFHYNAEIRGE